jgi:DNA-binding response OmpR family regulator
MAKILLIDDDLQMLNIVSLYLKKDGHEITTATNGNEGIKLLGSQQFDLVITDVLMPERDGYEVLMWLKKQTNRPKIIAVSGGSVSIDSSSLLETSKHMSADIVLTKPLDFGTFALTVRELLQ